MHVSSLAPPPPLIGCVPWVVDGRWLGGWVGGCVACLEHARACLCACVVNAFLMLWCVTLK